MCQPQNVIFQIKDAGIGIPEADQQRLFEPFYRASNVGDRPGTGLGLSIVKNIVESQGGAIELMSQVQSGTTVSLMLPMI
ncbi:MAG: sensor histidine kinase [Oculatellaceae cyanobacterium Prado106]|nr:sensor histidine kinase [Oculatellaceae cyanobacterium Prado106]